MTAADDPIEGGDFKPCPFCAEPIRVTATVCRWCNRTLPRPNPHAGKASYYDPAKGRGRRGGALARHAGPAAIAVVLAIGAIALVARSGSGPSAPAPPLALARDYLEMCATALVSAGRVRRRFGALTCRRWSRPCCRPLSRSGSSAPSPTGAVGSGRSPRT